MKSIFKAKIFLITIFSLTILFLFISCNGKSGEWLDNGIHYFCPDCQDKAWLDMIGECDHCGGTTASVSFKYCYDCAKELNRCQFCGVRR